jgi:uncharacterized protein YnzC (UPF0291/DUF896 family)
MLSQSPGIYIILAAVVSGVLLIINNLLVTSINNNFQLEREKQQGIRQQESERQKWYRKKFMILIEHRFRFRQRLYRGDMKSTSETWLLKMNILT